MAKMIYLWCFAGLLVLNAGAGAAINANNQLANLLMQANQLFGPSNSSEASGRSGRLFFPNLLPITTGTNVGLIPSVLNTLFGTPATTGTTSVISPGLLGNLFNTNLKAQILQAEAEILVLSGANRLLALQTGGFDAAKALCTSAVGGVTLTTLSTGVYYFETAVASKKTWADARNFCRQRGMDLVTIENAAEDTAVKAKITEILSGTTAGGADNIFWTGLNSLGDTVSNTFTWEGTGTSAASFTAWNTGEPATLGTDQCVMYTQLTTSLIPWDARACTTTARFICEVPQPCAKLLSTP